MAEDPNENEAKFPTWNYQSQPAQADLSILEDLIQTVDIGDYQRTNVSNLSEQSRPFFDYGLRLLFSYQHELASHCFLKVVELSPNAAIAHSLVALCHSPNYNFKGQPYYDSACHYDEVMTPTLQCRFPSAQVAERHAGLAVKIVEIIRKIHRKSKSKEGLPGRISDVECSLITNVRILTGSPGIDSSLSEEIVGRPYADAMRKLYRKYPKDPEVAYFFTESLMVLNAWNLYEYPSGKIISEDVQETRQVLQDALQLHPNHYGLCHLYVHLSEMSPEPHLAADACRVLRQSHTGHLIHMATHIDVLLGEYQDCVACNGDAIRADGRIAMVSPSTCDVRSFYAGYSVHNYHMSVYGSILGGFERPAREVAARLGEIVTETMLSENPSVVAYLESYSAMDVHVFVRFGRWEEILEMELPRDKSLMLFRTASLYGARALAHAMQGNLEESQKEADRLDSLRKSHPEVHHRILHNNTVADLLQVDATMIRGEIAYRKGDHEEGFRLLRRAVQQQDELNYDEPWGKMQPIRHALGGLLLEQGRVDEAATVFREDLLLHPRNPWANVGLIACLKRQKVGKVEASSDELEHLEIELARHRGSKWADFDIQVACECCSRKR